MNTNETRYLAGRVWMRSLPVIKGAPGVDAPRLKRLMLPQGELAQLHDDDLGIHYLAFLELKAGSVRGNHFHDHKQEFIYLMQGDAVLEVEDVQSKERASLPIRPGDLAFIAPGVAHALRVLQAGQAVEFSPNRFNGADIHRYQLGMSLGPMGAPNPVSAR